MKTKRMYMKQFCMLVALCAIFIMQTGCACGRDNGNETSSSEDESIYDNVQDQTSTNYNDTTDNTYNDETMQQDTSGLMDDGLMGEGLVDDMESMMGMETYVPGTYTGTAEGYKGTIEVTVEVDEERIVSVTAEGKDETEDVGQKAIKELSDAVVAANDTNVDSISGATKSSEGFFNALEDALSQARSDGMGDGTMTNGIDDMSGDTTENMAGDTAGNTAR